MRHLCADDVLSVCPYADSFFCTELLRDSTNCGACGVVCTTASPDCIAPSGCAEGTLTCQIGARQVCTHPQTDPNNCGSCGSICLPPWICENGICGCGPDGVDCGGGSCVDLKRDPAHCGSCMTTCPDDNCVEGICATMCRGLTNCQNRCTDTSVDASNCGRCGNVCAAGLSCRASTCVTAN
jgi:hypothetical protein